MPLKEELQTMCDSYFAAYRAGDAAGCAAVFTENGILVSAYAPPARGRAAIADLHREWTVEGEGKTMTVVDCAGSPEAAWFLAEFAEGQEAGAGLSLCGCVRQSGGPWQIKTCSVTGA